jgi:hypothetical protein
VAIPATVGFKKPKFSSSKYSKSNSPNPAALMSSPAQGV